MGIRYVSLRLVIKKRIANTREKKCLIVKVIGHAYKILLFVFEPLWFRVIIYLVLALLSLSRACIYTQRFGIYIAPSLQLVAELRCLCAVGDPSPDL